MQVTCVQQFDACRATLQRLADQQDLTGVPSSSSSAALMTQNTHVPRPDRRPECKTCIGLCQSNALWSSINVKIMQHKLEGVLTLDPKSNKLKRRVPCCCTTATECSCAAGLLPAVDSCVILLPHVRLRTAIAKHQATQGIKQLPGIKQPKAPSNCSKQLQQATSRLQTTAVMYVQYARRRTFVAHVVLCL